jgi:hypothetical protein
VLAGDLAQRAAAGRGLLDDLRRAVVADERVQRGRDGERALGGGLEAGRVGLDAVDALLGEELRRARAAVRSTAAGCGRSAGSAR